MKTIIFLIFIFSLYSQTTDMMEGINTENLEIANENTKKEDKTLKESYLNLGRQYVRLKKYEKAIEYFKKAIEAKNEDTDKAIISLLYLQASLGETNIVDLLSQLNENEKAEGYYMIAQGWEQYYTLHTSQTNYLDLAQEYYSILCVEFTATKWADKGRIKIASLFIREKDYETAIEYITPIVSRKNVKLDPSIPYDKAWYLFAQILEFSPHHKNIEKAMESYQKVILFNNSPYIPSAEQRIKYIKNFYLDVK